MNVKNDKKVTMKMLISKMRMKMIITKVRMKMLIRKEMENEN